MGRSGNAIHQTSWVSFILTYGLTDQRMPIPALRLWSFWWLWCPLLSHTPCPSLLLRFGGSSVHLGFSPVPASEADPREQKSFVPIGAERAAETKPWKKIPALNARSVYFLSAIAADDFINFYGAVGKFNSLIKASLKPLSLSYLFK